MGRQERAERPVAIVLGVVVLPLVPLSSHLGEQVRGDEAKREPAAGKAERLGRFVVHNQSPPQAERLRSAAGPAGETSALERRDAGPVRCSSLFGATATTSKC